MSEPLSRQAGARFGAVVGGRGASDDWITPRHIIDALGPFDLDPCTSLLQPWQTATTRYTVEDDGLSQPWHGMVWMNPPYSDIPTWLARLAEHGNGIALVFARTETRAFQDSVWPNASLLLFLRGRLRFHRPTGEGGTKSNGRAGDAGAPSVLIAYGEEAAQRLQGCGLPGYFAIPASRSEAAA